MNKYRIYKSELLGATVYDGSIYGNHRNIIAFYGGIFSQWAKCNFYVPELSQKVNCAEQAMMLHKANMFDDTVMYDRILNAKHPSQQKSLGRMVKGFDPDVWGKQAVDIVAKINYHKFNQNPAWKELLLLTKEAMLVEASPTDKIWGVGMTEDNPDIVDQTKWKGTNWLGKAIMIARGEIYEGLEEVTN
jgi:ribA/ribD-fused uncharacterized protein